MIGAVFVAAACARDPTLEVPRVQAQRKNVAVVGAVFAGLATACEVRNLGYDGTVYEKHDTVGGRTRSTSARPGIGY